MFWWSIKEKSINLSPSLSPSFFLSLFISLSLCLFLYLSFVFSLSSCCLKSVLVSTCSYECTVSKLMQIKVRKYIHDISNLRWHKLLLQCKLRQCYCLWYWLSPDNGSFTLVCLDWSCRKQWHLNLLDASKQLKYINPRSLFFLFFKEKQTKGYRNLMSNLYCTKIMKQFFSLAHNIPRIYSTKFVF